MERTGLADVLGWISAPVAARKLALEAGQGAVNKGSEIVGPAYQKLKQLFTGKEPSIPTNTTNVVAQYGPMTELGPLPQSVANTFRSGTYTEVVTTQPTVLYRAYGGTAEELGGYWTTTPPSGPRQSIIDSALRPEWGNPATSVVKIELPPDVTLYQGRSASHGGLVGGGDQVLLSRDVDPKWVSYE